MNILPASIIALCFSTPLAAQITDILPDSPKHQLQEVEIKAFEQNSSIAHIPAAVNYIDNQRLNRFNNTNILQAINATPGVRMEERSPGSYRLSVRGSSLRSPFGVRNVKVYYNGIPFTDPGGHTYFNQLGFYNFQSVEIVKGPGSSLYGAGTGGVMLINSIPEGFRKGAKVAYTAGSYGMNNVSGELRFGGENAQHTVRYQHLQSDGYRVHSALRRDVLSWDTRVRLSEKDQVSGHFLYGDMKYLTPGALTKKEFDSAPRMARPGNPFVPGAVAANASIREKTYLAGFNLKHQFSSRFQNSTTLYGAYTQLLNPTFSNYGRSSEPHFGGRTSFKYVFDLGSSRLDWLMGGEAQQGLTSVRTYRNKGGVADSIQTDDELHIRQFFGFTQLSWHISKFIITGGLSINRHHVSFTRFSTPPATEYKRDFDNQLAPRIAVLYKLLPVSSIYGSVSKGFSPPTSAELSPSGGNLNTGLNAEEGWNYELGGRGTALNGKFSYDINAYYFSLNNTIVLRRDASSRDFYLNAGAAEQMGVEAFLSYGINNKKEALINSNVWTSYTYNNSKYEQFARFDPIQQKEFDFSGNKLPSVAPHTLTVGMDLQSRPGVYLNLTYYYSDEIALDDANSAFADAYHLLGARLGYKHTFANRYTVDVFVGGENLADQKYSLGNDINGFGGRYYNVAMNRNFYAGVSLNFDAR
jgi:iron complex outermembrane receptor protein